MIFDLHKAGGKKLSERGFGSENCGIATVLTLSDGSPVTMQPLVLLNKQFGGQLILVPKNNNVNPKKKSYAYTSGTIYELYVNRYGKDHGAVKITEYLINESEIVVKDYNCGFLLQGEEVSFITACELEINGEEARRLLHNILFDAFAAAVQRSRDLSPQKMYYGRIAMDASLYVQKPRVKREEAIAIEQ